MASFRKRGCKCEEGKRCTCGATWYYRVDIGIDPRTGKRKQKEAGGFRTRAEAVTAAAQVQVELTQGNFVVEKTMLFKDFAEKWISMYAASGKVKESTVDIRRTRLKKLIDLFGHLKIKSITKLMYQTMLDDLIKEFARKTVASVHETGSLIFKKAVEMEVISSDPTAYAKVNVAQKTLDELEQEEDTVKYLEKDELIRFLDMARKCQRDNEHLMFLTLAYTGMRHGELLALKWKDIDFENQAISINKTMYNKNKAITKYTLTTPKTKKSKRTIEVDSFILQELSKHRAKQNELRMEFRNMYHDEGFVFARGKSSSVGYPYPQTFLARRMKHILKLAGLNQALSPHSLRHTHTSLLAEAGVGLETIMERLGHESDTLTKKIYLHVTKARKKEASEKFSELMRRV